MVGCLPEVGGESELRCFVGMLEKVESFRQQAGAPTDPHDLFYPESSKELLDIMAESSLAASEQASCSRAIRHLPRSIK